MAKLAATVIDESKDGYPELEEKKDFIFKVPTQEEEKFAKTIDQGLAIVEKMEKEMQTAGEKTLSGENAFKLYDTCLLYTSVQQSALPESNPCEYGDGVSGAVDISWRGDKAGDCEKSGFGRRERAGNGDRTKFGAGRESRFWELAEAAS